MEGPLNRQPVYAGTTLLVNVLGQTADLGRPQVILGVAKFSNIDLVTNLNAPSVDSGYVVLVPSKKIASLCITFPKMLTLPT